MTVPGQGAPLTEPELFRAYDVEPELCMAPECDHTRADHTPDGCAECPCRGFDPQGPADEYDRWRDDQLTDRYERGTRPMR